MPVPNSGLGLRCHLLNSLSDWSCRDEALISSPCAPAVLSSCCFRTRGCIRPVRAGYVERHREGRMGAVGGERGRPNCRGRLPRCAISHVETGLSLVCLLGARCALLKILSVLLGVR